MELQIDALVANENGFQAFGNTAQKLLSTGMNINSIRPWIGQDGKSYMTLIKNGKPVAVPVVNATLRKDEWKQYDQAILKAAQERLIGIADLESKGLVYNVANGLGKTVLEYEDIGDITAAEVNMDGASKTKGDRPNYDIKYLPLPIISKDFQINLRALTASRNTGDALDTTMAEMAAREVAEKAEDILFNGLSAYTFGGGTIRGYRDFANRNTYSLTAHWNDSAATGATMLADLIAMKQAAINDKHYGPYVLYIPTAYEASIDDDFKANSDKSIRQRLLEVGGITNIRVADKMTADNILLVEMNSSTVRLVKGLAITTVEWQSEGGMIHHYKVMAIMVPQIRADQNGNCGIVHGTL